MSQDQTRKDAFGNTVFPKPYSILNYHAIRIKNLRNDLKVPKERAIAIEKETRVQATSPTWFSQRVGKITVSYINRSW